MSNVRPHLSLPVESLAKGFLEQARFGTPSQLPLRELRDALKLLASSDVWQSSALRQASPGEELVYRLASSPEDGATLYLVSDGASTASKPHRHNTWAIIVGIRGYEANRLYALQSEADRIVTPLHTVEVGPLDALILGEQDIHSTEVRGSDATFHLHLYGRALHVLPSLASRSYSVTGEA